MSSPSDDTSVQVALRIRPQNAAEKIDMCHMCTSVTVGHPQVVLGKDKAFTYDFVFDIDSVQHNIYKEIARPLIEGCFEGYNATILAYGQTGSGKTYTMGTSFDVGVSENVMGIIPRAAKHLFDGIEERKGKAEEDGKPLPDIKVSAQFLELYNEEIIDLLDIDNKGKKQIKVHEDHNGVIYLSGVTSRNVNSAQDCMNILEEGAISRTTASTNMNATSSRSHAIFTVFVKHHRLASAETDGEADEFETLNAKFNFVDLAGSERLKRTGATGDRAKEGISINQGLLSLGNVISALGDKVKKGMHVPYRDSKLTRLLQDSLGGNSKTLMIACISPSDRDFMETLNTLKYANRARNIKNKVVVNQDKASKQIAMLRQEIQQLTVELLEYKQGKRVADEGGEYMTDTYQELEMLRTENENLRMRIKAMQQSIDSQTIELTEIKISSALAHLSDEDKPVMEEMVKKYELEIQQLKNKLNESEAMSSVAMRRADNVSRLAMSPGMSPGTFVEEETASISSVINAAKQEVEKERKLKKILSKRSSRASSRTQSESESESVINATSEREMTPLSEGEGGETLAEVAEGLEEEADDLEEGLEEEDEEDNESNTDSESDDELNDTLKKEAALQDDINDLHTDITIKQKLIDELEQSQQRLAALKHQYDQKLSLLHNKIKETEDERDKVLKSIGSVDAVANEKANEVKKRYEKKLSSMQKELSKLQNAKREHQRLIKTKDENERNLKLLRNELADMKKMKVKLMRRAHEEHNRNKANEAKLNRRMESALKETRKKELALQRLREEKRQRELIMKRKQEEVNALRRAAKPISGNVTTRRGGRSRPNKLQLQYQESANSDLNATFVVSDQTNQSNIPTPTTPTSSLFKLASPRGSRSPAVSKRAKQTWKMMERKIIEITIRLKNVTQLESDMERWLADRDKISKKLEAAKKRKEEIPDDLIMTDTIKDIDNQIEGMEGHLDFIQENIAQQQGVIIAMEGGEEETTKPSDLIRGCTVAELKYIIEHLHAKAIETAQELANKDASHKEIQIKLEAMTKHCEVQQQLLQHACTFGEEVLPPDPESEQINVENFEELDTTYVATRKARRKTALPEDLLHKKDSKSKQLVSPIDCVIKKVADLERIRSEKIEEEDRKRMPPPDFTITEEELPHRKSNSFAGQIESNTDTNKLSFPRNTKKTSSAKTLRKAASASNLTRGRNSTPSSAKTSPVMSRKSMEDKTQTLTLGQILASKATGGKPDGLIRMYTATGHNNAVLSLDVQNDFMVTGSKDRTAKVWDLNRSEEILSLSGHKRDVSVVKFSPLGDVVYTVNQALVKIWDLRTGNAVKTLNLGQETMSEIMDIGSNKDASILYTAVGNVIKRTDLRTYASHGKLTGHSGAVTCMLVTDTPQNHDIVISGSKDHSIKIFEMVQDESNQIPSHTLEPPHYDGVQSLALRGKFLFSGSRDNSIKKWFFENHHMEKNLPSAHGDWVTALNFIPGIEALVSGDRKGLLRLWDTNSCKSLGEIQAHAKAINAIKCNSTCIFSASSDRLVRIWKPSPTLEDQLDDN